MLYRQLRNHMLCGVSHKPIICYSLTQHWLEQMRKPYRSF
jgi:hypothetical protein